MITTFFSIIFCHLPVVVYILTSTASRSLPWVPETFLARFGFGLRPKTCRPSANTENSRRTREKPLVPRVPGAMHANSSTARRAQHSVTCSASLLRDLCSGSINDTQIPSATANAPPTAAGAAVLIRRKGYF